MSASPLIGKDRPRRLAYLLRLWQSGNGDIVTWRASLESAHTRERRAFSGIAALFAYLEEQTLGLSGQEGQGAATRTPHTPP